MAIDFSKIDLTNVDYGCTNPEHHREPERCAVTGKALQPGDPAFYVAGTKLYFRTIARIALSEDDRARLDAAVVDADNREHGGTPTPSITQVDAMIYGTPEENPRRRRGSVENTEVAEG